MCVIPYCGYVPLSRLYGVCEMKAVRCCHSDYCACVSPSGSTVFVKWKEGMWCRATLTELFQRGHLDPVRSCPVPELHRVRVYFQDYGFCKGIALQRYRHTRTHVKNLVSMKRDRTLICFFSHPGLSFSSTSTSPFPVRRRVQTCSSGT